MGINNKERVINTDVLVVGGGMAGFFAAIKARERGSDVTLVDKSYPGKAGSTHFSEGDVVFYRPERGHKIEEWLAVISRNCEYLNNPEWNEICLVESKDRYDDLVSWGVPFHQKDGKLYVFSGIGRRVKSNVYEDVSMVHRTYAPILRQTALKAGVRIVENVMMCDLIKQDGVVCGAVGFHIRSGQIYVIEAGAVVMATGSINLKSGSFPVNYWTGDGESMAYRAGAEVAGAEFTLAYPGLREESKRIAELGLIKDGEVTGEIREESYQHPFALGGNWTGWYANPRLNSEGTMVNFPPWDAHCGRAPLYHDFDSYSDDQWVWMKDFFKRIGTHQGDKINLDAMRAGKIKWPASRVMTYGFHGGGAGICPVDKVCSSCIPGLYAAGNTCATQGSGAGYAGMGWASNHAAVTGARAGVAASEFAGKTKDRKLDPEEVNRVKQIVSAPMKRTGGFGPAWVTQVLHGFTIPYFFLSIKHEDRLKPALALVEFVASHLVPQLKANNPHEWRLAHETKNITLIAEMKLRASLFRTESRGSHFREEYPLRDDPDWLAWVKMKDNQGVMTLRKEAIPEKWWPDLSTPYEERYPRMLPLE